MIRRLWRASIWHPDAIPPIEWKYRNLKRLWLPVYDLIAIWAGVQAVLFGSSLLNRLFPALFVDTVGMVFTVAAFAALLGVAFPRLWAVEIFAKLVLVALVAGYVAAILLFSKTPEPNTFVVGMLGWGLPLALFRLHMLGEEIKERRESA
ncbi:hypothetical protein [Microbacterium sp. NPDC080220]|uniref:hypothetical protein n=1 Tax=Microbacterium sp. NPDC080220 TaxID=3161017 RepID=UPI00344359AB